MVEVARFSETWVNFYRARHRHIPQASNHHSSGIGRRVVWYDWGEELSYYSFSVEDCDFPPQDVGNYLLKYTGSRPGRPLRYLCTNVRYGTDESYFSTLDQRFSQAIELLMYFSVLMFTFLKFVCTSYIRGASQEMSDASPLLLFLYIIAIESALIGVR
jgi:hypothetical protein